MKKIIVLLFLCFSTLYSYVSGQIQVIPIPAKVEQKEKGTSFEINEYTSLRTTENSPTFISQTEKLRSYLNKGIGFNFSNFDRNNNVIIVTKNESLAAYGKEAYSLEVTKDKIVIGVSDPAAIFTASQTFAQILPTAFFSCSRKTKENTDWKIPAGYSITDYPRFSWRAFMLDESRHFFGEKTVKQMIDLMALSKLNVLHWHLSDDIGWRIEIKKYPKLAQLGGWRSGTESGKWGTNVSDNHPVQGFYTQEQIKEIVRYAAERNIIIVPEIDVPGHATSAAIGYPFLATDLNTVPKEVNPLFRGDVYIDPSKETTYEFISNVMDEIVALFPSKIVHMGGDEIHYDQWRESKSVNDMMKREKLKTYADVQVYFSERVGKIIESKGARVIGWNDILGKDVNNYEKNKVEASGALELPKSTIIQFWKGDPQLAKEAAEKGYDIINSTHWFTYLDYAYSSISMRKAYNFDPVFEGLDPKYEKQIIGFGTQMWTEWVPTVSKLHYQVFPRMQAYAEAGWSLKQNKDYADFEKRLPHFLSILDTLQIDYAHVDRNLLTWGDFHKDKQIGSWNDSILDVNKNKLEIDITDHLEKRTNFDIAFLFTEGNNDMQIESVSIYENGKEIAKNTQQAWSGAKKQDNIFYHFQLKGLKPKAKYKIVAYLSPQGGVNSIGNVYLVGR